MAVEILEKIVLARNSNSFLSCKNTPLPCSKCEIRVGIINYFSVRLMIITKSPLLCREYEVIDRLSVPNKYNQLDKNK